MIEEVANGYFLNQTVKVFNIDYGGACDIDQYKNAEYDIEYNESLISRSDAITIAEEFFKRPIVEYLTGVFVQEKPKIVCKKLKSLGSF